MVTNTTVAPLYLDKVVSALTDGNPDIKVESVILPDGEKYKDMVGIWRLHLHPYIPFRGGHLTHLLLNGSIKVMFLSQTDKIKS